MIIQASDGAIYVPSRVLTRLVDRLPDALEALLLLGSTGFGDGSAPRHRVPAHRGRPQPLERFVTIGSTAGRHRQSGKRNKKKCLHQAILNGSGPVFKSRGHMLSHLMCNFLHDKCDRLQ